MQFTHVYAGFPGSVHDMRVFKYSGVQAMCLYYEDQCFPRNSHLIADSAYTNQKHVIVPYKDNGHMTVEERHFNKLLSGNRVFVECAIGLLKMKWRRLLNAFQMKNYDLIPLYIVACCILHNLDLKRMDELEYPVLIPDIMFPNEGPVFPDENAKNIGAEKRNQIKDLLNGD